MNLKESLEGVISRVINDVSMTERVYDSAKELSGLMENDTFKNFVVGSLRAICKRSGKDEEPLETPEFLAALSGYTFLVMAITAEASKKETLASIPEATE